MHILFGVLLAISVLGAGAVFIQRRSQKYLLEENQNLVLQQKLLFEYNESLAAQIELTDRLRKDIQGNLAELNRLIEEIGSRPEFLTYSGALKEQYENLAGENCRKKAITDLFVRNMAALCREDGIRTDIRALSIEQECLTEQEMLILISVLFDAGMEACRQFMKAEERYMEFYGESAAGELVLKMNCGSLRHMGNKYFSFGYKKKDSHPELCRKILEKHQGTFSQEKR